MFTSVEKALENAGYLDGARQFAGQIIRQAKYAVHQKLGRCPDRLTEKQIIWAYESYMMEIAQAEAEGYGCPNP